MEVRNFKIVVYFAQVAELVDALASGASDRKVMGVRVSPWAFVKFKYNFSKYFFNL